MVPMEEYHPSFGHRPLHDHHRRARRILVAAVVAISFGLGSISWSGEEYWGERQVEIARWGGTFALAVGVLGLVTGTVLWFAVDDDEHPDEPE